MFWFVGVVLTIMVWILLCRFFRFFGPVSFIEDTIEAENHDVEGASKTQLEFRNAKPYICTSTTSCELETKAVTI